MWKILNRYKTKWRNSTRTIFFLRHAVQRTASAGSLQKIGFFFMIEPSNGVLYRTKNGPS